MNLGHVSESRMVELREFVALGEDTEQGIAKFCCDKLLNFQERESRTGHPPSLAILKGADSMVYRYHTQR